LSILEIESSSTFTQSSSSQSCSFLSAQPRQSLEACKTAVLKASCFRVFEFGVRFSLAMNLLATSLNCKRIIPVIT